MTSTTRATRPDETWDRSIAASVGGVPDGGLPPATHREQAPDREADDRRPDHQLPPMLADLPPPVGQLGDAAAKGVDGVRQLAPLDLDVAPDLLRRAARGPGGGPGHRLAGAGDVDLALGHRGVPSSVCLIRRP